MSAVFMESSAHLPVPFGRLVAALARALVCLPRI